MSEPAGLEGAVSWRSHETTLETTAWASEHVAAELSLQKTEPVPHRDSSPRRARLLGCAGRGRAPRPQLWAAVCRGPHGPPPLGKPFSGLRLALLAEGTPEVQSHLLPRGRGTGGGTAKGWVWAEGRNSRAAGNPPPPRPSQPVRRFEKSIPQVYRGSHMQHLLIGPMSRCTRPSESFLKQPREWGWWPQGAGQEGEEGWPSRWVSLLALA